MPFDEIASYLLTEREYLRLVAPEKFWTILSPDRKVDELTGYTDQMWRMLVEIIGEWYDILVPCHRNSAWGPPIQSPPGTRVEVCLDQRSARRMQESIHKSRYDPASTEGRLSVFGGFGVEVPDEFRLEAEGMAFLARQADQIPGPNHYLIVLLVAHEIEW